MVIVLLTLCDAAVNTLSWALGNCFWPHSQCLLDLLRHFLKAESTRSSMLLESVPLWLLAYKQVSTSKTYTKHFKHR